VVIQGAVGRPIGSRREAGRNCDGVEASLLWFSVTGLASGQTRSTLAYWRTRAQLNAETLSFRFGSEIEPTMI